MPETIGPRPVGLIRRRWRALHWWAKVAVFGLAMLVLGFGTLRGFEWWTSWPARLILPTPKWGRPLAFSADGSLLAVMTSVEAKDLVFWEMKSGSRQVVVPNSDNRLQFSGAFSPDGRSFASPWNIPGKTRVFSVDLIDLATGRVRSTIVSPMVMLMALHYRDDGATIRLVVSDRKTILIQEFEAGSGVLKATRPITCGVASSFHTVSEDGRYLALSPQTPAPTGSTQITIWDLEEDREALQLPLIAGRMIYYSLRFSPDGRVLAIGLDDGTIQLWDLASRQLRTTLSGHRAHYNPLNLNFSRDGSVLSSLGQFDSRSFSIDLARTLVAHHLGNRSGEMLFELILIDTRTGQKLIQTQREGITLFSPDGRTLAATHEDGAVRIHDVPRLQAEAR